LLPASCPRACAYTQYIIGQPLPQGQMAEICAIYAPIHTASHF
jgi:hypothetical protein